MPLCWWCWLSGITGQQTTDSPRQRCWLPRGQRGAEEQLVKPVTPDCQEAEPGLKHRWPGCGPGRRDPFQGGAGLAPAAPAAPLQTALVLSLCGSTAWMGDARPTASCWATAPSSFPESRALSLWPLSEGPGPSPPGAGSPLPRVWGLCPRRSTGRHWVLWERPSRPSLGVGFPAQWGLCPPHPPVPPVSLCPSCWGLSWRRGEAEGPLTWRPGPTAEGEVRLSRADSGGPVTPGPRPLGLGAGCLGVVRRRLRPAAAPLLPPSPGLPDGGLFCGPFKSCL